MSGDDLRSVHELHHLNVLLQPVLCRDHALPRSRVLRRDLRLSGSNRESGSAHFRESGSTCLGRVQQPVLVSCGSLDSGRAS